MASTLFKRRPPRREQDMAKAFLRALIRQFCQAACSPAPNDQGDAQLLERFVHKRDETAFEVLVWRHAAMVVGVCQRVLRHQQDVEDAFQATFLTLVRKAASVGKRESVGSWLYKVAYRVALRARARGARQATHERLEGDVLGGEPAPDHTWLDLRPVLDEEINRLPEKYRAPVVLCYFE